MALYESMFVSFRLSHKCIVDILNIKNRDRRFLYGKFIFTSLKCLYSQISYSSFQAKKQQPLFIRDSGNVLWVPPHLSWNIVNIPLLMVNSAYRKDWCFEKTNAAWYGHHYETDMQDPYSVFFANIQWIFLNV